jgi:L-lactate dehydrogenase
VSEPRHRADELVAFARALLAKAGMRDDIAADVAQVLVDGEPIVVASRAAVQTWDGQRLPGPWLVLRALDAAASMAASAGTGTVVIRRSHHIACLAAYPLHATSRRLMAIVQSSDPAGGSVAPFGAVSPVFTPNPLAAGIPTPGDPILLDISASYTTNSLTARLHKEGGRLAHPWVQDAQGTPTDDPAVLFREPKGTLLPLGGLDAGHKGYALALLIEAMTSGLAGFGRADPPEGWGASVFVQVLDPQAFGGLDAFVRETGWLVDACHAATPRPGVSRVRVPGERGLALMREQRRSGVALHPSILPALSPWAEKLGIPPPAA